jgi:hypothetical protein
MATTGAPWNLFYPLGTDLVKDGAGDIQQLAEDAAGALTAVRALGLGTNVVQGVKTNAFTSTSGTFVEPGISATITLSSASSKVLIIAQISTSSGNLGGGGAHKVTRGGTDIYIGDAGTSIRAVFGGQREADLRWSPEGQSIVYLDTPGSVGPHTYRVESRATPSGSTFYINRAAQLDSNKSVNGASSITVIEVAA